MDTYEKLKKDWQDLQVTQEELKNLTDCLKKEEFRKLLNEYAQEVNDPENIKIYEKEITELEKQRGVDVTFVHPEPGYVIKTSINGEKKCFLNIGKSEIIARPTSQPSYEEGHRGLQWSIPYSLVPPRDDFDKKNVRCVVFDLVFHPDTIYLASRNSQFREIVNNTAMDGVETHFKVKLDRKNLRFPKMSVKGASHPTVIRKASKEPMVKSLDTADIETEIHQKLMSSYEEHYQRQNLYKHEEGDERPPPQTTHYKNNNKPLSESDDTLYALPKFLIKYQTDVEMEDFSNDRNGNINITRPKKLIVVIDLPLLKNAGDASLDVQERSLTLKSERPAKYKLELPLPYTVNADIGNAKFDSKYKKLTITLPVVKESLTLNECARFESEQLDNENFTSINDTIVPKIIDLHECRNSNFMENEEMITFMNPNVKYILPSYTFNVYDHQLITIVNVKNVDPDSIRHKFLNNNLGIHILFASIGAGLFPMHYSLCLKFDDNSIIPETMKIEPWDNNVILTTKIDDFDNLDRCKIGLDDNFMEMKDLPTTPCFKEQSTDSSVEHDREDVVGDDRVLNIPNNYSLDSDDEEEPVNIFRCNGKRPNRKHNLEKSRSISESSGDDLPNICNNLRRPSKGILKTRRIDDFSRSVSESSNDENICPTSTSSVDMNDDSIHDNNSESGCSNLKKTVRFNDVISRQLFRSNSSILGQRKKNQRKLNNKKRAHERRMSESETSENEERDKYSTSCTNILTQDYCDNMKPMFNQLIRMQKQKRSNSVTKNQGKSHK